MRGHPSPNARSLSSEEEDELRNEKKLFDRLARVFLRFSEEEVKKEVKPPTDLAAGRDTSTKEELDEESFRR